MTPPKKSLVQIRAEREQRCAEMRRLSGQGKNQTEIAELFGLTPQRVSQLVGKARGPGCNYPRTVSERIDADQKAYLEIQMCSGEKFLLDPEELEKVSGFGWRTRSNRSAQARYVVAPLVEIVDGKKLSTTLQLGRVIMGLGRGDPRVIDHINGDTLDNRKANLRVCTNAENIRNRCRDKDNASGFKGVTCEGKKWLAQIFHNGRGYRLGRFSTPEEAHAAYCAAAVRFYGKFANFG